MRVTAKLQIAHTKLPPNLFFFWLKIHPLKAKLPKILINTKVWGNYMTFSAANFTLYFCKIDFAKFEIDFRLLSTQAVSCH